MASGDTPSKASRRRGRPAKLTPEQVEELAALVRENPLLSLDDIVWAFRRRSGITLSSPTVRRYLLGAGFQRSRPRRVATATAESSGDGGAVDTEPS